jgi:hypothetical protein
VHWRSRFRAGAAALGVLAALGVATGAVEARGAAPLQAAQLRATARGSARAGGAAGRIIYDDVGADQIAVTFVEPPISWGSRAARREALAYWTQQRMQATVASALPRGPAAGRRPASTAAAGGRPSPDSTAAGVPPTGGRPSPDSTAAGVPPAGGRLSADSTPAGVPSAGLFGGSPTIGALFYASGRNPRVCTAAVVDSTTGNLVVTSAHCIVGRGFATNLEYVPDYRDGEAPYGFWPVTAITVARGWRHGHNPNLDLAFLTVAAVRGRQIQAATGGLAMGFNLGYDQRVEVVAYNNGNTEPVRCATRSFRFRAGQEEFRCGGFHDGTSGAPWVAGYDPGNGVGTLVGVLGGYEGGGIYQWASYSPYFGSTMRAVYQMAELRSASSRRAADPPPTRARPADFPEEHFA